MHEIDFLPALHLDAALDHVASIRTALTGPRVWWSALHTALADPSSLTERQRMILPGDLGRALDSRDDDLIVEAWLDATVICDRVWTVGVHCLDDRHLIAHLVLAAAQGAPIAIAELLCRDLLRMSAIDMPRWGGPVEAALRLDQVKRLCDGLGVANTPFRDLDDVTAGPSPTLVIDAITRGGVRHSGDAVARAVDGAAVGEVLVIDAGELYDRQVVQIQRRPSSSIAVGTELVSGHTCVIRPDTGAWTLVPQLDDVPPISSFGDHPSSDDPSSV